MYVWNKAGHKLRSSSRYLPPCRFYTEADLYPPPHPPFDLSKFSGSPPPPPILPSAVIPASERAVLRAHLNNPNLLRTLSHLLRLKKIEAKAEKGLTDKKKVRKAVRSSAVRKTSVFDPTHHTITPDKELAMNGWRDDWGEDKLRPPPNNPLKSIKHTVSPLAYSRRIEGLLEPCDEPALEDLNPPSPHRPIASLAHSLDRVLFNPGVHWLQDPRSRVYNFAPYLENIPKVTDFAFERLSGFIKSSRDEDLWDLAKREKRTYAGSTSSLSGILSHIYFLISEDKNVNTSKLSSVFRSEPRKFTPGQRMPASVVMNYKDGVYAIDSAGKDSSEKNILSWMGTLLEKFLTMTPAEFSSYMRSEPPPPGEENPMREAYRYAKSKQFVMRSQLDCHDPRLPGTGVFDIKTRACLPIRMDLLNYEENSGYLIKTQTGLMESFEREYYDLIRSAFLKYSFQVRMGNMDGVIVAYHNTARMFGFQYISLQEIDEALFGPACGTGDRVFQNCIAILENIVAEIIGCFPGQSLECTFEKEEKNDTLNIWVEPVEWENTEEERPIRQLEVKVGNFLGTEAVRGWKAVSEIGSPWIIHWSITRLSGMETDVRTGLRLVQARQFRAYNIPSGVENIAEWWEKLNFSGQPPAEGVGPAPYDAKNFKRPNKSIEKLRAVARSGREQTERLAVEEIGKPKYVVGVDGLK